MAVTSPDINTNFRKVAITVVHELLTHWLGEHGHGSTDNLDWEKPLTITRNYDGNFYEKISWKVACWIVKEGGGPVNPIYIQR